MGGLSVGKFYWLFNSSCNYSSSTSQNGFSIGFSVNIFYINSFVSVSKLSNSIIFFILLISYNYISNSLNIGSIKFIAIIISYFSFSALDY